MGQKKKKKKIIHKVLWIEPENPFRFDATIHLKKNFNVTIVDSSDQKKAWPDNFRIAILKNDGPSWEYCKKIFKHSKCIPVVYDTDIKPVDVQEWINLGVKKENIITEKIEPAAFAAKIHEAHKSAFRKK